MRRLAAVAAVLALAGATAALVARSGSAPPSSGDGRAAGGPGRVAMSSPLDPDARFFWELEKTPRSLIPLEEIQSGGPPPDGIPAIDFPKFESVAKASAWLDSREPVVALELNGDARAYPIQILTWHEIVNDVVGGEPVAVTFCPLCNSALTFSRRVGDLVVDFGTSGRLYRSDLVMYDRQTKSLWVQFEQRAVVGRLIGTRLKALPSAIVSWDEWRSANADGKVLSRDTGFSRRYGENPYEGYDTVDQQPFLFTDTPDDRLPPMMRVVGIEHEGRAVAYPFGALERGGKLVVVRDRIADLEIVVFYRRGTVSALDRRSIVQSRDVGAAAVYRPAAGGRALTLVVRGDAIVDRETGSAWNLLGEATSGPMRGQRLEPVPHLTTFWFAWAAFRPETAVYGG